jgi:predicted transcriptional regulator
LARRVDRDTKRIHEDIVALLELGLFEVDEASGGLVCPFATIHVDFELKAAA